MVYSHIQSHLGHMLMQSLKKIILVYFSIFLVVSCGSSETETTLVQETQDNQLLNIEQKHVNAMQASDTNPAAEYDATPLTRINDIFQTSSHNTYDSRATKDISNITDIFHEGIYSLELDLYYSGGAWKVSHWGIWDTDRCQKDRPAPNNFGLRACLSDLKDYHDEHPNHPLITVFLEPKASLGNANVASSLEKVIKDTIGVQNIFLPANLKGDSSSLRYAIQTDGKKWPRTFEVQGKFMFVLLEGALPSTYDWNFVTYLSVGLQNPAIFVCPDAKDTSDLMLKDGEVQYRGYSNTEGFKSNIICYNVKNLSLGKKLKNASFLTRVSDVANDIDDYQDIVDASINHINTDCVRSTSRGCSFLSSRLIQGGYRYIQDILLNRLSYNRGTHSVDSQGRLTYYSDAGFKINQRYAYIPVKDIKPAGTPASAVGYLYLKGEIRKVYCHNWNWHWFYAGFSMRSRGKVDDNVYTPYSSRYGIAIDLIQGVQNPGPCPKAGRYAPYPYSPEEWYQQQLMVLSEIMPTSFL